MCIVLIIINISIILHGHTMKQRIILFRYLLKYVFVDADIQKYRLDTDKNIQLSDTGIKMYLLDTNIN